MIEELSRKESQKLLSEQCVARLGCVLEGGEPYIVPVNYLFKDGFIFIHSLPGLKVEALRSNPKACIQVDDTKSLFEWRSAIAFGEFEEITESGEREEFLHEIKARFQELTPVETVVKRGKNVTAEMVVFRIRIRRITGMTES
jgi:nitroimidazol reductase NimA-like FMN-containing flavoprotein (pyridoxamine 5'-phosphate oxidase superfamily)